MTRVVLSVSAQSGTHRHSCKVEELFDDVPPGDSFLLECTPLDSAFVNMRLRPPDDPVRIAGEKLFHDLVAHPPLAKVFATAMTVVGGDASAVRPIFIKADSPDSELFPWETLWEDQNRFLSLHPDGRWPILRMAVSAGPPKTVRRLVYPELRVAAVLAAAGEKGSEQWTGMRNAFSDSKIPFSAWVFASEQAVISEAEDHAAAWAGSARDVSTVPINDSQALIESIQKARPNIIHFFCHGASDSKPRLEIETHAHNRGRLGDSIRLYSSDLEQLARIESLWLVVLNCCKGGSSTPHMHSLAKDLVTKGVPAVVGMREEVEVSDAHEFADKFYRVLSTQLSAVFKMRAEQTTQDPLRFSEVLWIRALHSARRSLSENPIHPPEGYPEWTYPLVYLNRNPLELVPRDVPGATLPTAERDERLATLDLLRELRSAIDLSVGEEAVRKRTEYDARMNAIRAELGIT